MKIKVCSKSYEEVTKLPAPEHKLPKKQSAFFRRLLSTLSAGELKEVNFRYTEQGMERLGKAEPCLILMNHSSFTDLNIVAKLFEKRPYSIVCTNDGFIGKEWLMRAIGCIPTQKFITDMTLIKDIKYALDTLKQSVVMYPEASYSFDGTETPLPESVGKFIKLMKVPVIMVKTDGAFLRDPLYNNLQKRRTDVTAEVKYLLGPEDIGAMSRDEINAVLAAEFRYDHFKAQAAKGVVVDEPFRADGLHRALYKCPRCKCEGTMLGKGTEISCRACNAVYELGTTGRLSAREGQTEFEFVSDWYAWERECVRNELINGAYSMTEPVEILILADMKSMYRVGDGLLKHTAGGFELTGCDGRLEYHQSAKGSYGLYADYFWYELGDVIAIGDRNRQYYCFPKDRENAIVAKARLAAEEAYKLAK